MCDRFEARLNSGGTPRIECYLRQSPRKVWTGLFRELLLLDIGYRGRKGEQVSPEPVKNKTKKAQRPFSQYPIDLGRREDSQRFAAPPVGLEPATNRLTWAMLRKAA